ncbi:PdxA family protein, partial [Planctomycetota bacterium]
MTQAVKPLIGITMGDPLGIGPEVAVKALADARVHAMARPLIIGHEQMFRKAAGIAGLECDIRSVQCEADADFQAGIINVLQLEECRVKSETYGTVSAEAGHAAFVAIERAIALAQGARIHGIVTGPINKEAINAAGHHYPGHTEILAHYTGTRNFAMLLAYGELKVIHVTTHIPLHQVSASITKDRVFD